MGDDVLCPACRAHNNAERGFCWRCHTSLLDQPIIMQTTEKQDSTEETKEHIARVAFLLGVATANLHKRAQVHDASKLLEPEKSAFDAIKGKLSTMDYGTAEYMKALDELRPALVVHYAKNSHHPEHYINGIAGMSLFDLIEMVMDWKAATERMRHGGNIRLSLTKNIVRFDIDPQLAQILENTLTEMGW